MTYQEALYIIKNALRGPQKVFGCVVAPDIGEVLRADVLDDDLAEAGFPVTDAGIQFFVSSQLDPGTVFPIYHEKNVQRWLEASE